MDKIKQLQQLKEMLDAQLISQEEYEKLKAELLNLNLNKIEVENQVNSTVNQVEQEKIEVAETKEETPKSVEESSTKEIEKEDFYTKEKSQYSKKGLFWFFLVVSAIVVFYQLHDRNVFKLRDKISEGYSDKVKIDIKDKVALEDYMQGKWSWERYTGDPNGTWRYRFEIIGDKLRIWSCMNNVKDPFEMGEGYDEFVFSLGDATRDVDGYNARYLEFGVFDNEYSLTYFALEPFWLVSDENWDTPVLRCSTGMPSWSGAEFPTTGLKLNREMGSSESDSNQDVEEQIGNQDNTQLSDEWLGDWYYEGGALGGAVISNDGKVALGNSVGEMKLTYSIKGQNIILYYDEYVGKIPARNIEKGTKIGYGYLLDGELKIAFDNPNYDYYGFQGVFTMGRKSDIP
jgi:hypothetical protein